MVSIIKLLSAARDLPRSAPDWLYITSSNLNRIDHSSIVLRLPELFFSLPPPPPPIIKSGMINPKPHPTICIGKPTTWARPSVSQCNHLPRRSQRWGIKPNPINHETYRPGRGVISHGNLYADQIKSTTIIANYFLWPSTCSFPRWFRYHLITYLFRHHHIITLVR